MRLVLSVLILWEVYCTSFEEYMVEFNRTYSGEEKEARRAIFERNLELINSVEESGSTYVLGLTRWSDRFDHQVSNGMNLKFKRESNLTNKTSHKRFKIGAEQEKESSEGNHSAKLEYMDWRQKGAVTPIREQGMCGACWAFASTAIIQSDFYIKTKVILDLSEEYIIECVGEDNTCSGGYFEDAYNFLKKKGGLPLQSRYPYSTGQLSLIDPSAAGICNTTKLIEFKRHSNGSEDYDISYYDYLTNEQLEVLITQSPLSTHFASNAKFAQYRSGIFQCNQTIKEENINHGVELIGFNSTGRYFIIKNSWGVKWGMGGFGHVSYDGDCGMRIRVFTFDQHLPVRMPRQSGQGNLEYEPLPLSLDGYERPPTQTIQLEVKSNNTRNFSPHPLLSLFLLLISAALLL